ncbi:hypothetical protein Q7P37_005059 [Cladosporium fusiforme]
MYAFVVVPSRIGPNPPSTLTLFLRVNILKAPGYHTLEIRPISPLRPCDCNGEAQLPYYHAPAEFDCKTTPARLPRGQAFDALTTNMGNPGNAHPSLWASLDDNQASQGKARKPLPNGRGRAAMASRRGRQPVKRVRGNLKPHLANPMRENDNY